MLRRSLVALIGLAFAVPAIAYIPRTTDVDGMLFNVQWSTGAFPIEWRMNPTVGSNITGANEQSAAFLESFQEWEDVSTAQISFTQGAATASLPAFDQINLITTNVTTEQFNSTAIGLTNSFFFASTGIDEFGRQIEFIGQQVEADIMFNPETEFSTDDVTPSNRIDLAAVAVHEIGHLLGLDHSNLLSSTMFPTVGAGVNHPRQIAGDDEIGVSTLYPAAAFSSRGSLAGTVRTTGNDPVFGALVVAVDANGQAIASQYTNPDGEYLIQGLPAGSYTVYAEPMNQPFTPSDVRSLTNSFPNAIVNSNFTVRFR